MTTDAQRGTTSGVPAPVDEVLLPDTVERRGRRRRPSGAPPPFPRKIGHTGRAWLVVAVALLVWGFLGAQYDWARRLTDQGDAAVLRQIARVRTAWLTDVMSAVHRAGSGWAVTAVAVTVIVAIIAFRRWRHLFTLLAALIVLQAIGGALYQFSRPRPYDVTSIGRWAGFSMPAATVAVVTMVGVAISYTLVVAGRPRTMAKAATAAVVALFAGAELYLAVYHPSDILVGVTLAVAIFVNAFRLFTPNEVFPVSYRRGKTAHLDVGGIRGEALRQAVQDQLGLTVVDVKPVGLAGSGGSTPLRICVAGDPNTYLFGKLYAMNHVRADRWYKLGRTILYGRLEDEAPFNSVRRLVEYEDYASRLMRDVGVPTAAPFGIVELTPEREYLLITEFFDGAVEIGEADVDDGVIDEGLAIIRRLWDAGVAHRDIKPANLLVRDGHVFLIDTAFVQVRPSPWRQAVDLANMMLVLAVRTDAERVYQRALQLFTADEIAEAFAAARGVASPTQLRMMMKSDGRDLLARFRALAPERRPIGLQRWSVRRVLLTLGLVAGALFAVQATISMVTPAYDLGVSGTPTCGTGDLMILMAQAVPTATSVPCIDSLPAGWTSGGAHVRRGRARFWLDSDLGGKRAVEVTLRPPGDCGVAGAIELPSDEVGMRRFEAPEQLPPNLRSTRTYLFDGGCITYRFSFDGPATAALMFDVDRALAAQPRSELVAAVQDRSELRLCGAGTACVGGS
ncbi:MAG: phosphatase PAP2 family protein [Acidimicrobiales bacterium]